MKATLASILGAALVGVLTLGCVAALVGASLSISTMTNPVARNIATAAEVAAGMAWLLATTWLSTQLAVRIYRKKPQPGS